MGVRIKGLDHLLAKVKKLEQVLQVEVDNAMSASTTKIAENAARAAPLDEGGIKNNIKDHVTVKFRKKVTVNKFYAPFVEFGTGKKTQVPTGLEAYAAGFKKKMNRGDFAAFVVAIEGWMKRHNITAATLITQVKSGKRKGQFKKVGGQAQKDANKNLAYIIARKILREGLKPQPYLFPAFFAEEKILVGKIQTLIKDAT